MKKQISPTALQFTFVIWLLHLFALIVIANRLLTWGSPSQPPQPFTSPEMICLATICLGMATALRIVRRRLDDLEKAAGLPNATQPKA